MPGNARRGKAAGTERERGLAVLRAMVADRRNFLVCPASWFPAPFLSETRAPVDPGVAAALELEGWVTLSHWTSVGFYYAYTPAGAQLVAAEG